MTTTALTRSARIGRMADEMNEALKRSDWIRVQDLYNEACSAVAEAMDTLKDGQQLLLRIGMALNAHAGREMTKQVK